MNKKIKEVPIVEIGTQKIRQRLFGLTANTAAPKKIAYNNLIR
jgi:hypothetical protein